MRLNNFFAKHPIFTTEDIAQFYVSDGPSLHRAGKDNHGTLKALLAYHRKEGHIVRIRRGLYYSIPTGFDKNSYAIDQYLIASKMTDDAIISHHAALQLHGIANSVRFEYTFLTTHADIRTLKHEGCIYKPILQPDSLITAKKTNFSIQTLDRLGMPTLITSLERTLVDILDRPDLSGGWEEIFRAFESVTYIQTGIMIEYAKLLDNATTSAKLGFLLEQYRDQLMITDKQINQLHKMSPRTPHYMDRRKRSNGKVLSDWNLIVPIEILERRWEENL
jgi:predicted transcriptional regulator of viral defense system